MWPPTAEGWSQILLKKSSLHRQRAPRETRARFHGASAPHRPTARVADAHSAAQPGRLPKPVHTPLHYQSQAHIATPHHFLTPDEDAKITIPHCVLRDRSDTPTKAAYLGADRSGGAGSSGGDDEVAGEISANQELMQIFQGSPRCAPPGPTDSCVGYRDNMQPPSRNQNPLVKDQVFILPLSCLLNCLK